MSQVTPEWHLPQSADLERQGCTEHHTSPTVSRQLFHQIRLLMMVLGQGRGRKRGSIRARETATENSDPRLTGLNAMPGSTLRGQCPKGEATRLPAGSQEIGSYDKVISRAPCCPGLPCPSGKRLHLTSSLNGSPGPPLASQMVEGRRYKINPRSRGSEVSHKPGILIKSLAQSPFVGLQGLPKKYTS